MKTFLTADRLKQVMEKENLRQVDILEKCKPFCKQYNVKLGRNDLSQYVSGKVEPGQEKLTILGLALGINEVWLMGYDVPMYKNESNTVCETKVQEQTEQPKYIIPEESKHLSVAFYDGLKDLTQDDIDDVVRYMNFIKSKKK